MSNSAAEERQRVIDLISKYKKQILTSKNNIVKEKVNIIMLNKIIKDLEEALDEN